MPVELRKFLPRVVQRREPFHIQTLVPQLTVEISMNPFSTGRPGRMTAELL